MFTRINVKMCCTMLFLIMLMSFSNISVSEDIDVFICSVDTEEVVERTDFEGYTWSCSGPFDGNVPEVIEYDDVNDVIFVGNCGGDGIDYGLYRSVNDGDSWEKIRKGRIYAVAIDPTNPDIIYAGLGYSLLKSIDGGDTWTKLGDGNPLFDVIEFYVVVINPENPDIVYAGGLEIFTGWYLFKSIDAGDSWTLILDNYNNPGIAHLALDPLNTSELYGGVYGSGIYYSNDSGISWEWLNSGLTNKYLTKIKAGILPDVSDSIVFVATDGGGVYIYDDVTQKWVQHNQGLPSKRIFSLAVMKSNASNLYAGSDTGVFKTSNAGQTWENVSELPPYHIQENGDPIYPTVLGLQLKPSDSSQVICSTHSCVYRSTDSGNQWQPVGLPISQITDLAVDPNNPNTLYAGSNYGIGCVYKSSNYGDDWLGVMVNNINAVATHPTNSDIIYAGTYSGGVGFHKSIDAGQTWTTMNNGLVIMTDRCIETILPHPQNEDIIYIGTLNGVFKTETGGSLWYQTGLYSTGLHVNTIAIDPHQPSTLYAGTYGNGLFKSTDNGTTWIELNTTISDAKHMAVGVDPNNSNTIYSGTYEHGILKTIDQGTTWQQMNTGLPSKPVRALLVTNTDVYAGLWSEGVYNSTNGGTTWLPLTTQNMHVKNITCLKASTSNEQNFILFAGTYGGGIYRLDTTQQTIEPHLTCDGSISWNKVKPGSTQTATFRVINSGDPNSELNWEIQNFPEWGTWTFTPDSGTGLTPEQGPITVQVEVIAPETENTEYSGEIFVVNTENTSNSASIPITLSTPKTIDTKNVFLYNIFTWLLEKIYLLKQIIISVF